MRITASIPPNEMAVLNKLAKNKQAPVATILRAVIDQALTDCDDPSYEDSVLDAISKAKVLATQTRAKRASRTHTNRVIPPSKMTRIGVTLTHEQIDKLYALAATQRLSAGLAIRGIARQRLDENWPEPERVDQAIDDFLAAELKRKQETIMTHRPWEHL